MAISVQFIKGLDEEISSVSLRQRRGSSSKIVVLVFEHLQAIQKLRAYRNQISNLWLKDEEGEIQVTPNGIKFLYIDDDTLSKVECSFEVNSESAFERVMRFLHRYAEVNGFQFQSR
ncbi:MAG: photosystem II reaction center protein Psb28 [Actinomycetota bacterium]